jgi:hypothetical protein
MLKTEPFPGAEDKERFIAALRGKRTERVPHFEILVQDHHVEKLLGRPRGRWVAGSSHSIVNYIPLESFVGMINAIHKYGVY